jgi:hypothetical protein
MFIELLITWCMQLDTQWQELLEQHGLLMCLK